MSFVLLIWRIGLTVWILEGDEGIGIPHTSRFNDSTVISLLSHNHNNLSHSQCQFPPLFSHFAFFNFVLCPRSNATVSLPHIQSYAVAVCSYIFYHSFQLLTALKFNLTT